MTKILKVDAISFSDVMSDIRQQGNLKGPKSSLVTRSVDPGNISKKNMQHFDDTIKIHTYIYIIIQVIKLSIPFPLYNYQFDLYQANGYAYTTQLH